MPKYENSLFPYSVNSTVNVPTWRSKHTNVTLMSFLRLFTKTVTPMKKKICFLKTLNDKYCQK